MEVWSCHDEANVREAVAWAAAEKSPLRILGAGTTRDIGRPVEAARLLDLSKLAGITLYEPNELVLRARAGTRMAEIEAQIAAKDQCFFFEPRDLGPLFGAPPGGATLGGIVSTNLAGPRRFKAGAVRDHVLGFTGINGRAEVFKSGGRVMKNVTGYDFSKLMTGAFGTLSVLTEITVKVMPRAETACTLALAGLDDGAAIQVLKDALALPHDITGAAHLPAAVARRSKVGEVAMLKEGVTLLRVEGEAAVVDARLKALGQRFRRPGFFIGPLAERGGALVLEGKASEMLWREIRDVSYFVDWPGPVWRVSTAPTNGPSVAASVGARAWFYDWAGGLVWLLVDDTPHADDALVRRAVLNAGGHATLIRASAEQRKTLDVFEPQPPALAALTKRVKASFDPLGILNPGLMYPDV